MVSDDERDRFRQATTVQTLPQGWDDPGNIQTYGPTASPAMPSGGSPSSDQGRFEEGKGWFYDWRQEPYQNQLGAGEIRDQQAEYRLRNAFPNMKFDATGANLKNQIAAFQSGGSPFGSGSGTPFQFDDPYTKQLEELIRRSMDQINAPQSNPGLDQYLSFLNKRFTELSNAPGYSNDELALIRTQMLEPIERDRQANRERILQRTASRGMLPSSGLHEQDLQDFVDRPAMESRTGAQRDIALNAIGKRTADLNQASQLGRIAGIEIPELQRANQRSDRSELLNLASLLYDLPNRAMQSAQSVIGGSPAPQDLFGQAIQMQQTQQQQRALNAQRWSQIGQLIAGLFQ